MATTGFPSGFYSLFWLLLNLAHYFYFNISCHNGPNSQKLVADNDDDD
jgi:hypothetical protein